ncbi:hypothetical protein AB833_02035 [Chromatiales bacterium (ex Bugula neritina AB1)]|nr:hypothetical protein AB833_02035 [Chromatiales bacterium (ex Bugula neritina AB1)]
MAVYEIDAGNKLYYEHTEPTADNKVTFVFFNPLTGDTGLWKNSVAKSLADAGHGLLVYNMRGQPDSPFSDGTALDQALIVDDAKSLLEFVAPPKPVFVGLSIGGIYAAWAAVEGAECAGLVFLNTLRRDGPRLKWINDTVVRLAQTGGGELLRDVMSPLIMNEDWQAANRGNCLTDDPYTPMPRDSGAFNLLSNARDTNWDFPYERLTVPTLVVTGIQDRVFRDPVDIDTIYARLPNARRVELQNAGHMIPVEQPQVLTDTLLDMAGWVTGS